MRENNGGFANMTLVLCRTFENLESAKRCIEGGIGVVEGIMGTRN